MGVRIRRPSACQGITKKEAKKGIIPEGDFQTREGMIEENWIRWDQGRNLPLSPRGQERKRVQRKRTEGHICKKHHRHHKTTLRVLRLRKK
eukprot:1475298-Heterocapsa_arctica.AAC.1